MIRGRYSTASDTRTSSTRFAPPRFRLPASGIWKELTSECPGRLPAASCEFATRRGQSLHGARQVLYPSGNCVCGVASVLEGVIGPSRIAMGMTSATQAARARHQCACILITVHACASRSLNSAEPSGRSTAGSWGRFLVFRGAPPPCLTLPTIACPPWEPSHTATLAEWNDVCLQPLALAAIQPGSL
jgi:hypothetical protein